MTEREPSGPDTSQTSTERGRPALWWTVLAPAAALLIGVVLGGVLVGVVADDDDVDSSDEPSPTASPTPGDAGDTTSPSATLIVVPDECLAAVETVQQALELADRSAEAIRDFQPEELRELLREIEDLEGQARAQAQACQEIQTQEAGPTDETS